MNQPNLYRRYSDVQRYDAKRIIEEFQNKLKWRHDGHDRLIDIGCGSGDILIDFLYSVMPKNFDNLMGVDISPNMINHASKLYSNYCPKCTFKVLDIAADNELPLNIFQQYDHVTSFYCLHWIQNLRQALKNIYNILRPEGGDCLLAFLVKNPIFDVYTCLSKSPKWSKIMYDVDKYITPLNFIEDVQTYLTDMLKEIGFSDIHVDIRDHIYTYKSVERVIGSIKAICPFFERLPINEHENFINDIFEIINDWKLAHYDVNEKDAMFTIQYKLAVVYASK